MAGEVIQAGAPEPVCHIVGALINVANRYVRQRCAWCGALIVEVDLEKIPVVFDPNTGKPTKTFPSFPPGAWLRITRNPPPRAGSSVELLKPPPDGGLPDSACCSDRVKPLLILPSRQILN